MASMNHVLLMGNLTRDPEFREFGGGGSVCKLGLAVSRRFSTRSGEDREETCFVDVDVFGRQAESAARYLSKGRPVFVEGRLKLDQWEDRETGQKRSRLLVVAQRVQFLRGRGPGDREGTTPPAARTDVTQHAPRAPFAPTDQDDDIVF